MPLSAGTAVVLTNSDTAYQLSNVHKLVKRVVIQPKSGNTGILYVGTSLALKPSTNTGIFKQCAAPSVGLIQDVDFSENDAPNGLDLFEIWCASSVGGDVVIFGYNEQ